MTRSLTLFLLLGLSLASCSKSSPSFSRLSGTWILVKEDQAIGASSKSIVPEPGAMVRLQLNDDQTYKSMLNNTVVCGGKYTLIKPVSQYPNETLELDGFKQTGIFSLFYLYQMNSSGQVISEYHGMTVTLNGNTLTLTSPITPGGFVDYVFKKG